MRKNLDSRVELVVDRVEERADDLEGVDVTQASNLAHDLAVQDPTLVSLCELLDDLDRLESDLRADRSIDRVRGPVLEAGHDLVDACRARVDELTDEAIEEATRLALEEATA